LFELWISKCTFLLFQETRPANFPVVKQVQVLDLVREGKLVHNSYAPVLIEVVVNDRMGKRQRIKCCPTDKVLQLKKLISAQIGTRPDKIRLQKANIIYKDHISLEDYEIKDGMGLEMYYD
jgi:ubiquitin-like protein 5